MKHLRRIDEAVGSIVERRASAESLLKMVAKGSSKDVEGIELSKEMADAFLDWLRLSAYGKKFGALPFYKLFTAAFNWGLSRYTSSKELKKEYKELNIKAKEMSKAEMNKESLDEAQSWNSIAKIMDKGLKKATKSGSVPLSYAKDYVKSLERMAKKSKKKFFDEYGNFSEDDFIEDVEYNIANESKVNEKDFEPHMMYDPETGEEYKAEEPEDHERMSKLGYVHEKPESVDEAFTFTEDQVKDVAEVIAKAIAKADKSKTAVHDMEYDKGRGAGFEISMDGDLSDGGSYTVRPNGDIVNSAIGNSFPNAVYAKVGDSDINKIIKNIKKFESFELSEAAPKMKKNEDAIYLQDLMNKVANAQKGGMGSRYGKEFDKSKTKALRALKDMVMYSKIGI